MRSLHELQRDIAEIKQSIKYARQAGDEREEELLLEDLDHAQQELWQVQDEWYRDQNDRYADAPDTD